MSDSRIALSLCPFLLLFYFTILTLLPLLPSYLRFHFLSIRSFGLNYLIVLSLPHLLASSSP